MPTPEQLSTLADLGWATLFLGVVIVVTWGLHRQHWVPGWVFRAERDRRVKAEAALERATNTIEHFVRGTRPQRRRADAGPTPNDH